MRLITPSQLSLFSISPVIGAWWEELQAQKLFDGSKPAVSALDQQLFADGLRHEQVLLTKLEKRKPPSAASDACHRSKLSKKKQLHGMPFEWANRASHRGLPFAA